MITEIIVNTGPLITLAKIDAFHVAALSMGLDVVGVLGLLARAKKDGIIDSVSPYVRKAIEEGVRYHPELVRRILSAIGEA